jgi:hypothetical protein
MNALERLLQDDLNRLIDRIAASACEGLVADCAERRPELGAKLAESEARVSAARHRLLEDYSEWRDALASYSDLWELAALFPEPVPAAGERRAA